MENDKDNKKGVKNSILVCYYMVMALWLINMLFIFIGYKKGIDMFLLLIVEMILFILFIFIWGKITSQNEKNNIHIQRPLYVYISLLLIHMSFNIILYKIGLVLTSAQDLLKSIIELIFFAIVLMSQTQYKEEIRKSEQTNEYTNIDKYFNLTAYITIMIWVIYKIIN